MPLTPGDVRAARVSGLHRPGARAAAQRLAVAVLLAATAVGLGACSESADDGSAVRGDTASGSGSGSGSEGGSGGGSASGAAGGSGSASAPAPCAAVGVTDQVPLVTVEARLSAFVIQAIPGQIPAAPVNLVAVNMGFEDHEVVILRYDGDPADLPMAEDGTLDEAGLPAGTVVGEIEAFAGQTESPETVDSHDLDLVNGPTACQAPFDLAAGEYLLLCNVIAEHYDGEVRAHFERGMFTRLTVTGQP